MKNSTKHLLFQTALLSLLLAGCSSINTAKERTVRDFVMEVINNVKLAENQSLVLIGYPSVKSSSRSESIWLSCKTAKQPAAYMLDIGSMMKSELNERETRRSEEPGIASQMHQTILVGNALEEVLSDGNTTEESTKRNYIVKVSANDIPEGLKTSDFIVAVTANDYMVK